MIRTEDWIGAGILLGLTILLIIKEIIANQKKKAIIGGGIL